MAASSKDLDLNSILEKFGVDPKVLGDHKAQPAAAAFEKTLGKVLNMSDSEFELFRQQTVFEMYDKIIRIDKLLKAATEDKHFNSDEIGAIIDTLTTHQVLCIDSLKAALVFEMVNK